MSNIQKFIIPGRPPKTGHTVSTLPLYDSPVGFEQLAINGATGLASIPAAANKAVIVVDDASLRYRDDGENPTADIGIKMFKGGTIVLNSRKSILQFKAIKVGTNNSELNVSYYERK